MARLTLSIAIGDYDHIRDLLQGDVRAEGIDLVVARRTPVEEIFHRFAAYREWDISELSFAKYCSLASQPDCDLVAIPVFPSRAFRHSSIYVRAGSALKSPAELCGAKVGVPEWAQTAAIYTRGMLMHDYGVPLRDVQWVQGGVNQAGRREKVALRLPEGVSVRQESTRPLSELLAAGELDAVFSARPPAAFSDGSGAVVRMFADPRREEIAYWEKRRVFPIMHVVAIRKAVYDAHPWVAMNLLQAFEEAKRRSLERAADVTASFYPLPWVAQYAEMSKAMFGPDFWPYGVEANRHTLRTFLDYVWEQGVTHRAMEPGELFARTTLTSVKV